MTCLAVVILTFNEEIHLPRALASVAGLASEVFVVDSYSTDRTLEIARTHGTTVLQHRFSNQAQQFQWALDHAPITADWVMRLDADEVIEPDLAAEMAEKLPILPLEVSGVNLKRKQVFMGKWIRHGGRYPVVMLRLWRRGKARVEQRWMDEHLLLNEGRAVVFNGGFSDCNLNNLGFFTEKHNKYATREAIDVINQRRGLFPRDETLVIENSSYSVNFKRLFKERLYNRLPFELSATGYYFLRYVLQLGFLDGREGLIYHFLQGFWYRFLVGAKVVEMERALGDLRGEPARIRIAELTGLFL